MITTDYSKQAKFIKVWYADHFPNLTVTRVTATLEDVALAEDVIGYTEFCVGFAETDAPHIMSTNSWVCKGSEDLTPVLLTEWVKMRISTRPWR